MTYLQELHALHGKEFLAFGIRLDLLAAAELLERFVGAALLIIVAQLAAFVVSRLSFGQAEFDFGFAALEVDAKRNERVTALLELGGQFPYLAAMQQQLSITQRIHVVGCALLVRRDMHAPESNCTIANNGVPVLQRTTTITEGFHLRAGECDARLEYFFDRVLMTRFSVGGDNVRHGEQ